MPSAFFKIMETCWFIDSFEIFIGSLCERSDTLSTKATITPQGYISDGYEGRTSDKYV